MRCPLRRPIWVVASLLAAGLLGAPTSNAETRHLTAAESSLVADAEGLLEKIEEARAEYAELERRVATLEGEERTIAASQMRKVLIEFMRSVEKLVANVAEQREEGIDAAAFRQQTLQMLWNLDRRIPAYIDGVQVETSVLRTQKESATPEGQANLDRRIERLETILDEVFRFYRSHVGHLETMGLSGANARKRAGERLTQRATSLANRVELAREQLDEARQASEATPGDTALEAAVVAAHERMDRVASSLWTTCDVMENLDLPTAEYRAALITATGEITTDLLDLEVVSDLLEDATETVQIWLEQRGPTLVGRLSVFFGVLAIFWLLGKTARWVVTTALSRSTDVSELARRMIVSTVSRVFMGVGFFVALSQLGVNVTALVAGLGIAGFIVGFALQDTLGNFASGAMILAYRPFDVGDVIEAGGVSGKVDNMNLVSTTILTFDNQTLVVPNSKIWGDVIRNVTYQKIRRVDLEFHLSHDADVEQVEKLFDEMCRGYPTVLEDPPPAIRVHEVNVDAVVFIVRPWVKTEDYWATYWDLNREAKVRLAAAGIPMGASRHEVHVQGDAGARAS